MQGAVRAVPSCTTSSRRRLRRLRVHPLCLLLLVLVGCLASVAPQLPVARSAGVADTATATDVPDATSLPNEFRADATAQSAALVEEEGVENDEVRSPGSTESAVCSLSTEPTMGTTQPY